MQTAGTPSHRRLRLGVTLRQAREAMDPFVSQAQAATASGMSQSEVHRLESAQLRRIRMDRLNALMAFLGISGDLADELRGFARAPYEDTGTYVETSSNAQWWQRYVDIERDARVIKTLSLTTVDGLIQSPAYMRRQFHLADATNIEAKIEARVGRQRAVINQDSPPLLDFILEEACLHISMGDQNMLLEQLRHLVTMSELPHVTILIKPFDAPFAAVSYPWTYLGFSSVTMRDFVSVKYETGAATIDDENALLLYQQRWEQVRAASLSEVDSRELLAVMSTRLSERVKGT